MSETSTAHPRIDLPTDNTVLAEKLARLAPRQRLWLLRKFAAQLEARPNVSGGSPPLEPAKALRTEPGPAARGTVAVYPASPSQQRMWFLQRYTPESPVYSSPTACHLAGPLDLNRLEMAFGQLIRRHQVLRTTFVQEEALLFQHVASISDFRLEHIDLTALPVGSRRRSAQEQLEAFACRPFDLAAAPAFRALLVRLQPEEHVLLLVLHHSGFDGWSRTNLWRELAAGYAPPSAAGQPLPELPWQYVDYCVWHDRWLKAGAFEEQSAYWSRQLANLPEPIELPADRPRPAVETYRGARCLRALSPALVARLQERAQEEGATLFMILVAAFNVLLHRYTGDGDLVVGVPIANRQRPEIEGLIGFFANTLVLRTVVAGGETFRELLRRTKATALEAYAHQDMPFERLLDLLRVRRDPSRSALFQVSFSLLDFRPSLASFAELECSTWEVGTPTAKFDLGFTISRSGEGWETCVEYSTDLFNRERIERMLVHWTVLLEGVAANPSELVFRLPLVPPAEWRRLIMDWNQTRTDYPRDACVHTVFEAQVVRAPDAVAVRFEDATLSYRELNAQADRLAAHLRHQGVVPGDLVALELERSIGLIVALVAILKAGGAYWAIEANLPPARRRMLFADARPRVRLVAAGLPPDPESTGIPVVVFEAALAAPAPATEGRAREATATDGAYVNYTSGSTGRPKGVLVPHRGVVRLVKGIDYLTLKPGQIWLHLASLSFDAATLEIWGALLNGGTLAVLAPGPFSLADVGSAIRRHRVDTLILTTALFHSMVDHRLVDLEPVRQLLMGGDVMSPEHLRRARDALPQCRIVNAYGPTENTTITTCWVLSNETEVGPTVPIGRPIANTRVFVLDRHLQPVPIGVPGELVTGGDGLACGYLGQPALTAERFIPDHLGTDPGARLYRTGDRVRWRPDGQLEFIGRIDGQVKLRGFRLELGEVETALRATRGVRDATVVIHREGTNGKLLGYVALESGAVADEACIRLSLQQRLPDYMVPAQIKFLADLPLTSNGKIDRRALPVPETRLRRAESPRTMLEFELMRLWRELFRREDIGRDDNFFDLGGHSLLAASLVAQIERKFERRVSIAALFQAPTISDLAAKLSRDHTAPDWSSLVPLQPQGSASPVYFAHGWGGDLYSVLPLARLMAPDQPVYGLQAVGLDGLQQPHAAIEDMARYYASLIRARQPQGPYRLAGYSLGGWVAYAVAHELVRQGETVSPLILFDARAVVEMPWRYVWPKFVGQMGKRLGYHLRHWRQVPLRDLPRYAGGRLRTLVRHVSRDHGLRTPAPLPAAKATSARPWHDYFAELAARYRPPRYAGDVALVVSGDATRKDHAFWRYFVRGKLRVFRATGGHLEIIDSAHAAEVARLLRQVLREADAKVGGPRKPQGRGRALTLK